MRCSLALFVFCWLLAVSPTYAEEAPARLVVTNKDGNPEIYTLSAAGEWKNLTNNKAVDVFPAWSPDGKQIAFSSNRNGAFNIYLMNADGSGAALVTSEVAGSPASCMCPSWSPDGDRIAYMKREGAKSTLVAVDTDGDHERIIAEDAWDPAWSPGGDKIAFTSLRSGEGWKLYTVEPDGGKLKMIVDMQNKAGYVYPAWSPDGKQLCFTSQVGEHYELHVCDKDGGNVAQLTKAGRMNTHGAWSSDGKTLYFLHDVDGTLWKWMTVTADGKATEACRELEAEKYLHGGRIAIPVAR